MKAVIRHLRAAALCSKGDGPSDGNLLECFILRRDELAFEALVRRHGPMVLGVCRRVLGNADDAEDAFQATFLVLARKAASVKPREMVGNWLYGVSYRTAMKARAVSAKRKVKEKRMEEMSYGEDPADEAREELLSQLDYELNRLPDKYRVPVVFCELQGKTRREAACMLGIPEGTLSSRLAYAKKLLGRRLSRFGTVAVTVLLAESAASARLSPLLRVSTTKAALTAGVVPAKVLILTEGVIKTMFLNKLKITVCSGTLMLLAGLGASGLSYRATAQSPQPKESVASRAQTDELEALRLEIEALRTSLQATRERVKTLEEEVGTMKKVEGKVPDGIRMREQHFLGMMGNTIGQGLAPSGVMMGAAVTKPATASGVSGAINIPSTAGLPAPTGAAPLTPGARIVRDQAPASPAQSGAASQPQQGTTFTPTPINLLSSPSMETDFSLSHAEKALKRLQKNPNDTKSIEMLERALNQLKERKNQKPPKE